MARLQKIRTVVWISAAFEGFHRYVNAPDDVAFLREWHRHIFHVKIGMEVSDLNREIEFFQFKRKVKDFLLEQYSGKYFESSCEMIARDIQSFFDATFVSVSEDGENGALVDKEDVDA